MNQQQSSCHQTNNKGFWRTGIVFVAAFLSLSIVGLWIFSMQSKNQAVAYMGAGYALLCTGFLAAQLVAFVRAHMDYDQTIEKPKFELLRLEEQEWKHLEK